MIDKIHILCSIIIAIWIKIYALIWFVVCVFFSVFAWTTIGYVLYLWSTVLFIFHFSCLPFNFCVKFTTTHTFVFLFVYFLKNNWLVPTICIYRQALLPGAVHSSVMVFHLNIRPNSHLKSFDPEFPMSFSYNM